MAANTAETKTFLDNLVQAVEAEVDERKASLAEARAECAAAVREATAAEAVGRNDDMDKAAQQISAARWATAELARTAEATAAALLKVREWGEGVGLGSKVRGGGRVYRTPPSYDDSLPRFTVLRQT
jgi:hypothetical protein